MIIDPSIHMWVVLSVIAVAVAAFASERIALELTALAVIAGLLLFFQIFPLLDASGQLLLNAKSLLAGLSDPALIAVLALLVVGQGIVRTGALELPVRRLIALRRHHPIMAIAATLTTVLVISAFLNNTPVVVIFIPLMTALAERLRHSVSHVMIPLSYAAILGGMTTLIGSSTNLLVSSSAESVGLPPIGFSDFTIPGLLLASVGLIYAIFLAPKLLPDRASLAGRLVGEGKQFIVQLEISSDSPLVGESALAGRLPSLPDITVRFIQRGEKNLLPPFDDVSLKAGDVLILGATRKALTDAVANNPKILSGLFDGEDYPESAESGASMRIGHQMLAEVVVAPASRMIGRNLQQIGFHYQTDCVVLGIQRRSRMIRTNMMNEIRLEAGDVLLVLGRQKDVVQLRANQDVLLLEWSARELPAVDLARRALMIFATVVLAAASGLVPIVVAAVGGAAMMIATGCLNIYQASRAIDRRILLLVWAALSMGGALQATGGAGFVAHGVVALLDGAGAGVILSAFFLLVALATNILSNNATAVLFTPVAANIATELGVEPMAFVYAVIFAANCSFATPMGYQTNLLVMSPGHYQFRDFVRAGVPLLFLIWGIFSIFAPWYYGF